MSVGYAVMVGILFALSIYLLLLRDRLDHVLGIVALTHAANLLVFGAGRLERGEAPILDRGHDLTDPLPQALVLTAIVIGFGVTAFAIALVGRLRDPETSIPEQAREEDSDG
jgi:multisubunit Na+/H+ antiporter MnhC subunit